MRVFQGVTDVLTSCIVQLSSLCLMSGKFSIYSKMQEAILHKTRFNTCQRQGVPEMAERRGSGMEHCMSSTDLDCEEELGSLQAEQTRAIAEMLALSFVESSVDVEWMWRTQHAWSLLIKASFDEALQEDTGPAPAGKGRDKHQAGALGSNLLTF